MVVLLVGERGFKKGRYCADDSMRRASAASSMWRPGCQLFLAFVRSQSTQTRKSRACISRSHGPTTTPTSPTCAEHRGPNGLKLEKETTHVHHSWRRLMPMKGRHHNTSKRRGRDLRLLVRDLRDDAVALLDAVSGY